MNVLRFMQATTAWMNRYADNLGNVEPVEGEAPKTMLTTQVIALFQVEDEQGQPVHQIAYDVVGVETKPGGDSMVIRIATPPPAAEPQESQEDQ